MSEQAIQSLESALKERVRHYGRLRECDLVQAALDLIDEAALDIEPAETVAALLTRVAALGSIDAVAVMVVMECSHEMVAAALRGVAERSEDVKEGMLIEGLTAVFEEWAEEEIAAGHMTKFVDPASGKTLYQSVEKKSR